MADDEVKTVPSDVIDGDVVETLLQDNGPLPLPSPVSSEKASLEQAVEHSFYDLYTIGPVIGQGGQGRVHRVINKDTGEARAAKIYGYHEDIDELAREGKALQRLDHPKIMRSYEQYTALNPLWSILELIHVTELVEGKTAAQQIESSETYFNPDAIKQFLHDGIDVLTHAHSQGIFHRDLTPDNILINPDGSIHKVIDFGIARFAEERTRTGTKAYGTPLHMPPEQMKGRGVSEESDYWNLALTAACLAAKKFPADDESHYDDAVGFIKNIPNIAAELRSPLLQMVDPDKAVRRKGLNELLDVLEMSEYRNKIEILREFQREKVLPAKSIDTLLDGDLTEQTFESMNAMLDWPTADWDVPETETAPLVGSIDTVVSGRDFFDELNEALLWENVTETVPLVKKKGYLRGFAEGALLPVAFRTWSHTKKVKEDLYSSVNIIKMFGEGFSVGAAIVLFGIAPFYTLPVLAISNVVDHYYEKYRKRKGIEKGEPSDGISSQLSIDERISGEDITVQALPPSSPSLWQRFKNARERRKNRTEDSLEDEVLLALVKNGIPSDKISLQDSVYQFQYAGKEVRLKQWISGLSGEVYTSPKTADDLRSIQRIREIREKLNRRPTDLDNPSLAQERDLRAEYIQLNRTINYRPFTLWTDLKNIDEVLDVAAMDYSFYRKHQLKEGYVHSQIDDGDITRYRWRRIFKRSNAPDQKQVQETLGFLADKGVTEVVYDEDTRCYHFQYNSFNVTVEQHGKILAGEMFRDTSSSERDLRAFQFDGKLEKSIGRVLGITKITEDRALQLQNLSEKPYITEKGIGRELKLSREYAIPDN